MKIDVFAWPTEDKPDGVRLRLGETGEVELPGLHEFENVDELETLAEDVLREVRHEKARWLTGKKALYFGLTECTILSAAYTRERWSLRIQLADGELVWAYREQVALVKDGVEPAPWLGGAEFENVEPAHDRE